MRYRPLTQFVGAVAAIVVSGSSLQAQMCSGNANFSAGPARVAADAEFGDHVKGYGANLALGAAGGAWLNGSLSLISFDDIGTDNGKLFGLVGGYSVPVNPEKTVEFCPLVGFNYQSGPNVLTSFGSTDLTERDFNLGGAIGGVLSSSPDFGIVPFVSGQVVMSKSTSKIGAFSSTDSQNYGLLGIGAGFMLNKVVTIRPIVNIPVGLDGAKASYGVGFGYNFGK